MRIVVVGGSLAGLSTAMLLARTGHEVVVLDRDSLAAAPDVEAAAEVAFRPGAPQIVQLHNIRALGRNLLKDHLPDVYAAFLEAGVVEFTLAQQLPARVTDRSPRPGDERLTILQSRRSTLDWVLRRRAAAEPGVTLRGGVRVTGLVAAEGEIPRVTGVSTDEGELAADLVVDTSGRRTGIDRWLAVIGAARTTLAEAECGVSYYSRYYRLRSGAVLPGPTAMILMAAFERFLVAFFGADNQTMGLSLVPLSDDRPFKAVRAPAAFTAVARTIPQAAEWLDVMDPVTGIHPMGDLHNTLRRLVVDGAPVAHGLVAVGDSVCTTNPTFARGIAFAMQGATHLVRAVADHPPDELAKVMDEVAETHIAPWFEDQAAFDSARLAALRHAVHGAPPPAPRKDDGRLDAATLRLAAGYDAEVFRAHSRLLGMLRPAAEILDDPELVGRVREILARENPRPPAGPGDEDLAAALAAT